jgi:alkyl hydroperoxide reductase subunit AhpF
MDPITLILTALVAGTAQAAGDAVPDAYKGLKALIQKKFAGQPTAEMLLNEYETDPETYTAPLKKNLLAAAVDQDADILQLAEAVLAQANPQPATPGTIAIGQGAKGIIGQTVTGATITGNIN